ncbi:hypothetical protein NI17_006605 [Thermobifida halotolerans]|uniref:Uncharacterized protein n=1 Tax=Thermobifida halotolerans TaxID=483545 RepID=A0AA97LZT3_9ACTN|nr:hypothetical protein [Thermobifida halotolerans]UOE20848.1 hypothetical protein NI17_006605 [Thermobifida halotolerans]
MDTVSLPVILLGVFVLSGATLVYSLEGLWSDPRSTARGFAANRIDRRRVLRMAEILAEEAKAVEPGTGREEPGLSPERRRELDELGLVQETGLSDDEIQPDLRARRAVFVVDVSFAVLAVIGMAASVVGAVAALV